jgi:two-component system CheB/CheR fusion protein
LPSAARAQTPAGDGATLVDGLADRNDRQARGQTRSSSDLGPTELLECAGMAFMTVDADLRIDGHSPGAGARLGLPAVKIGGEAEVLLRQLDRGVLVDDLYEAVMSRAPSERELTTAQGRRFLARIRSRASRDGWPGAVIAFVDLGEPAAAAAGPSESDQADLIAVASHELRQPLQSVGLLNAALRQVTDHDEIRNIVRLQRESLDQVNDVLESLLDLGTLSSGEVRPEPTQFAIARILDRLRADFYRPAADKDLGFDIQHVDAIVECDRILLTQMLESLVANAIHRSNRGFVRLWCEAGSATLTVLLEYSPPDDDPKGADKGSRLDPLIALRIARLLAVRIDTSRTDRGNLRVTVRIRTPEADEES